MSKSFKGFHRGQCSCKQKYIIIFLEWVKTHSNLHTSDKQPQHSNHGKGGVCEQLAAVAKQIHPDLNPGAKQSRTKEIPDNVLVNAMAPPAKKH